MSRFVSQCCSCSFAYNITCPSLKVPIQPTVVGCASAECIGTLPCLCLQQCGDPIWAFGDGLSAVNGIVTGADSALDATCDFACCFTRTCPCIQYNLTCCTEVYQNPGVYAHRIRYVTDSFEVSEFSEPGLFCICQGTFNPAACGIAAFGCCTINICSNTSATDCVNNCVKVEFSLDSEFSSILCNIDCTGSCITSNCTFPIDGAALMLDSNNEYLDAGTILYTRATVYGAATCCCVVTSDTANMEVAGELYTFALCNGVGPSASKQGCDCIQLYATYMFECGYNVLSSAITQYKFEVSPFCDFCSDVTTECGSTNVFIQKSSLAGSGACSNYYVRTCILPSSFTKGRAPNKVRCVHLGNVTYTAINQICNNPDCNCGNCCSTTISHTGPIAVFGIGSGGVGSWNCPNMNSCLCVCAKAIYEAYQSPSGGSGHITLCCLENPSGCLNGCTFCMYAGHPNCGSVRCSTCACGKSSYFCIQDVLCVSASGAGLCGAGGLKGSCWVATCIPYKCYNIASTFGASGHAIISDSDEAIYCSAPTWTCGFKCWACNCRLDTSKFYKQSKGKSQLCEENGACYLSSYDNRLTSYFCDGSCVGSCGSPSWPCNEFPADGTYAYCGDTDMVASGKGATSVGLNWYGLGGFGAIMCATSGGLCENGVNVVCNGTGGFGWGAGGVSYIECVQCCVFRCCHCDDYSGYRGWSHQDPASPQNCACMFFWPGRNNITCYSCFINKNYIITGFGTGGAGGMMFMCNCCQVNGDLCTQNTWQGKPGIMMFACQDY